jgi:hypothetical protein
MSVVSVVCCQLEADHSSPTLCGVSSVCDFEVPSRLAMTQNRVHALQEKYSVRKLEFVMPSVRLVLFMYQLVLVSFHRPCFARASGPQFVKCKVD